MYTRFGNNLVRVLQIIPTLGAGGAERQLALLANELIRHGIELHVAFRKAGANLARLAASGAHLHEVPLTRNYDPRILLALSRIVRTVKPDVAHTWLLAMDVLGGLASRRHGVPWLLSERSSGEAYARRLAHSLLRKKIAVGAAGVVGNSHNGLAHWKSVFADNKLFHVPNIVPLGEIAVSQPIARSELPIRSDLPLVAYGGRFSYEKNTGKLFEALTTVVAKQEAVAAMFGAGPEWEGLVGRVKADGLSDSVHIGPYRDDIWSVLKSARVAISVSRYEGSPNFVLDAMACGCRIVVSDIPAHRELLGNNAAWYVDGNDAASIAAGVRYALNDPDGDGKVASAKKLAEAFSAAKAAAALAAVYGTVGGWAGKHNHAGVAPLNSTSAVG